METLIEDDDRIVELLTRLSDKSVEDYYNPFTHFDWAETLPADEFWMPESLLSTHGTTAGDELTSAQLRELSKWESINFYSMNVHGIRELIIEVVNRIHMPGFEVPSEFFHHFIGEENEHMWFFAQFCNRYGGKLYPTLRTLPVTEQEPFISNVMVFARIVLFEEIVDHYNVTMAADETLHPTIREVNRVHHRDESRHIAFGRELVSALYRKAQPHLDAEARAFLEDYLKRYILSILYSFSNPRAYKDAGLKDLVTARSAMLASPRRRDVYAHVARKPLAFLYKAGIVSSPELPEAV